ncbi:MAG: RHS repeat-associated core domain-containing protein [Phycisphaerae bacterium]
MNGIAGDLPVILMELDASDMSIKKAYIYGNSQVIAQYDGNPFSADKYFYLHDRLGSVREMINDTGAVVLMYTYNPFGELIATETTEDTENGFMFTGQQFDSEINQYYLRARQYEPHLGRFVSRDPVLGKFEEPLTLHKYLYCGNDPLNRIDPAGLLYTPHGEGHYNLSQTQDVLDDAINYIFAWKFLPGGLYAGGISAFGWGSIFGEYPGRARYDYKDLGFSFKIASYSDTLKDSEFGNYIVGYSLYYNAGLGGEALGRLGGHIYGLSDLLNGQGDWHGLIGDKTGTGFEDWGSIFWITKGALDANRRAQDYYKSGFRDSPPPSLGFGPVLDRGLLAIDEMRLIWQSQLAEAFWMTSMAFGD